MQYFNFRKIIKYYIFVQNIPIQRIGFQSNYFFNIFILIFYIDRKRAYIRSRIY